ncbi:3-deoxy-D-manno-octulosonic acid kinase [Granulosicoccaceae sp. 1_MG-2023]|nr:3-deoxy-D-manno-octulosonic acid kinase [Granulosicoccaceae sp. 1_MG-2023]
MPELRREGALYLLQSAQGGALSTADFDAAVLRREQRWHGEVAGGRGRVWFAQIGGQDCVIRHYRRGGLVARLSERHYVWCGLVRSRVFRELQLLEWLAAQGLPVPVPVGGLIRRRGLFYEAALVTAQIPGAQTLAARLATAPLDEAGWCAVGRLIRRFHDAGLWHADLNANNILFDESGKLYLIDFDRGRRRAHKAVWKQANLARLRRSLDKIAARRRVFHYCDADFSLLQRAYGD